MSPSTLLLRTAGPCDFNPAQLLEVFGAQRKRFLAVLQAFGPADWEAPTRCGDWSAHQVVRHLCDSNTVAAGTDTSILDIRAGFDPRVTPGQRLTRTAGESPATTLGRLVVSTDELLGLARERLARGCEFDVCLPYGHMDWTVLVLHAFWDSWLHERDVLLARGAEHPTDDAATLYATMYGVFLAAAVAPLFGKQVRQTMILSGEGGGVYDLDTSEGAVTLTVTRTAMSAMSALSAASAVSAASAAEGPPAAEVADALGGRAPVALALATLPGDARAGLSCLADFFNTPVKPRAS